MFGRIAGLSIQLEGFVNPLLAQKDQPVTRKSRRRKIGQVRFRSDVLRLPKRAFRFMVAKLVTCETAYKLVILCEYLANPRMVFSPIIGKQFELHDLVEQAILGQGVATGVVQLPAQSRSIL